MRNFTNGQTNPTKKRVPPFIKCDKGAHSHKDMKIILKKVCSSGEDRKMKCLMLCMN